MENNNWEPRIGQKVIALKSAMNPFGRTLKKGETYTVDSVVCCPACENINVSVIEISPSNFGISECVLCPCQLKPAKAYIWSAWFAPINPYSNNISQELAEKAMEVKPEIDVPIKKEVVNN